LAQTIQKSREEQSMSASQEMPVEPRETESKASDMEAGHATGTQSDMSNEEFQDVASASDIEIRSEDKEEASPKTEPKTAEASKTACCCLRTRRRKMCCFCCSLSAFLFAVAVAVCLPLFWPQDPQWSLTKLELLDESALSNFVAAFSGYATIADDAEMPNLYFMAEVELHNPNRLGGKTGEGTFTVFFGDAQLGNGTCAPANVEPLSKTTLYANVSVQIYPSIFKEIAEAVLANELKLTVHVSGSSPVTGLFGIGLTCGAECDIHTDVVQVLTPGTRHKVIESKQCTYFYNF